MSSLYNLLKRNIVTANNNNNRTKTGTINESNESYKAKSAKKGKKGKADNSSTSELPELPDSITCNGCKQVFTDKGAKILCCDHCETWYCTKCAQISDAGYNFLSSKEAEDMQWFCKTCIQPAKLAVKENKNIEDKIMEHTEKPSQQIKVVETGLQKKADTTELEKLQKRVKELEDKYRKVPENSQEGKTWVEIMDISEKRTVEGVIKKSLKNRESEEKDRQNRRKNIIIFGLPESKKTASEDRKEEDSRKFTGVCKNIDWERLLRTKTDHY